MKVNIKGPEAVAITGMVCIFGMTIGDAIVNGRKTKKLQKLRREFTDTELDSINQHIMKLTVNNDTISVDKRVLINWKLNTLVSSVATARTILDFEKNRTKLYSALSEYDQFFTVERPLRLTEELFADRLSTMCKIIELEKDTIEKERERKQAFEDQYKIAVDAARAGRPQMTTNISNPTVREIYKTIVD